MHFLFVEDISNGLFLQDEKYQLLQWFLNQYPCTFAPSFLFLVHSWTCKTWYIVYLHDLKKSGLVLQLFSRSCLDRQLYFVNCSIFGWWGFRREQTSAKWTSQTLTFASLTPTLSLSSSQCPHERLHKCIRTSQNILQRLPCPQKLSWKKKNLWHTKRKRWYSRCKLHTRPHMEHPNAHTHKQSLAKWLHRWGRDPVLLSPSLLHLPAIRLGADRENGGRGRRGAEGQEEDWWLGTEGGMIIPLTLCPIPGSHPAAPGEKREKDPANICDRSTPTH